MTDVGEIAELEGPVGESTPETRQAESAAHDGLSREDLILLDALPLRSTSSVEKLSVVAGLGVDAVRAGLGRLGLLRLAHSVGGGWKRAGNS